ncbi:TPA: DNA adenine methylase, partial [Pasteurella multocida]|nr:DNA adenine methylase [Pasteurella multocida]
MAKQFKQAPLPFTGQKRMFLKYFKQVLDENIQGDGEDWTIIDVFGGSGLLSHTARCLKPKARVIYNDFDWYSERLNHITETNQLRELLYQTVKEIIPKNKLISKRLKEEIINKINNFNGYKDVNCLSSWLLFSGQQVGSLDELFKQRFYNRIRKNDYVLAEGYLDGLEIVNESFHQLLPKFQNKEKVLMVLDPPYICTRQESYKQATYFDLIDFLRLIHLTKPPFIFFSSTKSEFIRFLEYTQEDRVDNWQVFEGYKRIVVNASINVSGKY